MVASPLKTATPSWSFSFSTSGYQRGFARTDRAHEVDGGDAVSVEQRAVLLGQFGIGLEQAVLQFDVVDFVG